MLFRFVRVMFGLGLTEPIIAAAIAARNTTAMITHRQRECLKLTAVQFLELK